MKSPRNWALQHFTIVINITIINVEMKSPRNWALQQKVFSHNFMNGCRSRNEKPEKLGIATGVGVGFATLAKS